MGTLSADKVAQWKYDGFLSPFPLLDDRELEACRQGVERYEAWLGSPINAHPDMKWRSMHHLLLPWAARLARDARITTIYEGTTQLQVVAAAVGIMSGTLGNYLTQLGERAFRPELMKLASLARESRERVAYCAMFLKNMNDRTYSDLVARRLVDMASDALGAHLLLVQAEKDAGRTPLAAKVFADVMPRIRMQADYITSGDKLVIEQRAALL